jgi:hypothetical protein
MSALFSVTSCYLLRAVVRYNFGIYSLTCRVLFSSDRESGDIAAATHTTNYLATKLANLCDVNTLSEVKVKSVIS